ncbi:MAG: translation initiation factor IF-1 [Candidatus Kaiserbacteria bacterium]|nr:translation initiation factor IF-1 [Candidatus Kaiserbacteria bacterium]
MTKDTTQPSKENEVVGSVLEALPSALFRVAVEGDGDQEEIVYLSYLSGRMRMNRIKVMVGDRVTLVVDQHGERARIVKRL